MTSQNKKSIFIYQIKFEDLILSRQIDSKVSATRKEKEKIPTNESKLIVHNSSKGD